MKILYYDCFAGISGDMNLGALIDLGVDQDYFIQELKKLHIHGVEVTFESGIKNCISGIKAHVNIKEHKHHDHGHDDHHHGHHHHDHRSLSDIKKMILESKLNEYVKDLSIKIFTLIGISESKIHNIPLEKVHFHEVGALDSIVDIVGAAICIDYLKPDKIMASSVQLGGGFVHCAHGIFPVPAPATAEILQGIPVKTGLVQKEMTTPTGAAILAACVNEFSDNTNFTIKKTGYGLGERNLDIPNVLRAYLAEGSDSTQEEKAVLTECNIDDMNPEVYDYVIESLFAAGANDVFITPILMKKSRPAVKLSILHMPHLVKTIEKILFEETTTVGLRQTSMNKIMLNRETETISTPYGKVRIKHVFYEGKPLKSKPEYEDCLNIAREQKMSIHQVYKLVEEIRIKQNGI
ncbi:MAG: nickel pincer cofactor biosynthesis protein LarC [Bacteroidales bacterium]|nr:nickel pincer cofactor biosynthesis protein LarC [Bacteroidales bacterium]